ncbi:hypothetical protein [Burkholderia multivorans]|uniref:hypothetical protein n=1 Tax=Burkholderia multivorans TaxID=87883 RepID=UPI0011B21057|nr:hypothetical protein [Burkholderia multivorans]
MTRPIEKQRVLPTRPGAELCKALVKHEPRFTLAELRPDIWGNGIDAAAASDDVQPPAGTLDQEEGN